ncbi:hypothetical protein ACPXCX_56630, partial [Streptomyces sp. DT225]
EHCLSANSLRKARDTRLTAVTVLFGFLFLPGMLLWVIVFRLRDGFAKTKDRLLTTLGNSLLPLVGIGLVFLMIRLPLTGLLGLYLRA